MITRLNGVEFMVGGEGIGNMPILGQYYSMFLLSCDVPTNASG